jgi:hypothetical protein
MLRMVGEGFWVFPAGFDVSHELWDSSTVTSSLESDLTWNANGLWVLSRYSWFGRLGYFGISRVLYVLFKNSFPSIVFKSSGYVTSFSPVTPFSYFDFGAAGFPRNRSAWVSKKERCSIVGQMGKRTILGM